MEKTERDAYPSLASPTPLAIARFHLRHATLVLKYFPPPSARNVPPPPTTQPD